MLLILQLLRHLYKFIIFQLARVRQIAQAVLAAPTVAPQDDYVIVTCRDVNLDALIIGFDHRPDHF